MPFPSLPRLAEWAPVELTGLGLLTILDWLPTFGSFVVADNQIAQSELGFVAHNITEVATTPNIASWFTRWLNSFLSTHSATVIRVRLEENSTTWRSTAPAMVLGFMAMAPLLAFAIIIGDAWASSITQEGSGSEVVKVLLVLPNSKIVTILGPRILIIKCMLIGTRQECTYRLRAASWAALGVHALALGMSSFLIQIFSLLVLLLGTYLTTTNAGANREAVGSKLRLEVDDGLPTLTLIQAYARLGMDGAQEKAMSHWGVIPHNANQWWWNKYREAQRTVDPFLNY